MRKYSNESTCLTPRWAIGALLAGIAALTSYGCTESTPEESSDVATNEQSIHLNPGSTISVSREPNSLEGRYNMVMATWGSSGCTGSVIAPYAVVNVTHCGAHNYIGWLQSSTTLSVSTNTPNPYSIESLGFTPDWWLQLNDAQQAAGGRVGDWPAQHGQQVLFVPALTPQFLADHDITPLGIDPNAAPNQFEVVGVASTGYDWRDSAPAKYVPATPDQITQPPRDGYSTRDISTPNYAGVDHGDSGGPAVGFTRVPWVDGSTADINKTIYANTQDDYGDPGLGYNLGVAITPNQRLTNRLNALWLMARADDADGDGLPTACDPDPGAPSTAGALCPPEIGGPRGAATLSAPVAQLQCKLGYLPVALKGRAGWLIDQLQLKCSPVRCIQSGTECSESYYTDVFGGDSGDAFEDTCPSGQVLVGFKGTEDGSIIASFAGRCAPYSKLRARSAVTVTELPQHGGVYPGTSFSHDCGSTGALQGVQLRTSDKHFVTGMQEICISTTSYSDYAGGSGGGPTAVSCPPGTVAIGTTQRAQDGTLNVFGLLCANRSKVAAGVDPMQIANISIAHDGFWYYAKGIAGFAATEPYEAPHLPDDMTPKFCPAGSALSTVSVYYNNVINRVDTITCTPLTSGSPRAFNVGVGTATGGFVSLSCGQKPINGFYARNGWLTDGLMMKCE